MKKILATLGTASTILAVPTLAFAQAATRADILNIRDILSPIKPQAGVGLDIVGAAVTGLNILILIAGILAIFFLILAGIRYITAGNDPDAGKKARAGIYNAVIGIIVIVLAYVIIQYTAALAGAGATQLRNGGTGTETGF